MPMRTLVPFIAALLLLVLLGAAGPSTTEDALWDRATLYFDPLPDRAEAEDNPITRAKVDLGRSLYLDPRLSRNGNVSCNSCHSLATFGVDRLPTSPGDEGELGPRNSPTVLNAAFHVAQFWDGRASDVEEQAGMPILNPVEMGIPSREFLVDRLREIPEYAPRFQEAFPEDEEPLSYENIGRALGAFERTLVTPSPFDRYLQGDRDALGEDAKAGLGLFVELGCASCHNGVAVGGAAFRKFGLNDSYWEHTKSESIDEGRFTVTGEKGDRYVFKVASLRNVAETAPYFHDGSVETLDRAVEVMVELQVGMELSPRERQQLTSFLESLTGELPEEVRQGIEEEMASRPPEDTEGPGAP